MDVQTTLCYVALQRAIRSCPRGSFMECSPIDRPHRDVVRAEIVQREDSAGDERNQEGNKERRGTGSNDLEVVTHLLSDR